MTVRETAVHWIRRLASFEGRASRNEFWMIHVLTFGWCALVNYSLVVRFSGDKTAQVFAALPVLLVLFPVLGAMQRRANEIGWRIHPSFIAFVPCLFLIVVDMYLSARTTPNNFHVVEHLKGERSDLLSFANYLFFFLYLTLNSMPSQPGPNKYGPNPHEVTP